MTSGAHWRTVTPLPAECQKLFLGQEFADQAAALVSALGERAVGGRSGGFDGPDGVLQSVGLKGFELRDGPGVFAVFTVPVKLVEEAAELDVVFHGFNPGSCCGCCSCWSSARLPLNRSTLTATRMAPYTAPAANETAMQMRKAQKVMSKFQPAADRMRAAAGLFHRMEGKGKPRGPRGWRTVERETRSNSGPGH